MKRGWLGEKTGSGFYKRVKGAGGESEILTLDWQKMEYRPQQKARFASIEAGKADRRHARAPAGCWSGRRWREKTATRPINFFGTCLSEMCLYAARRVPEIADRIVDVDRAMRWGFAWELGPFEIWDAIGVERMAKALEREGKQMPPLVAEGAFLAEEIVLRIGEGKHALFRSGIRRARSPSHEPPGILILKSLKDRTPVVQENSGASLIDLGDGVLCCEFHSKMNAIGGDIIAMIQCGRRAAGDRIRRHGDRQPGAEFFRRREPDAAADDRAGRRMGRYSPGRAAIPAHEHGDQVRAAAGGRRAAGNGAGRRLRNHFARAREFTPRRKPISAWSKPASA